MGFLKGKKAAYALGVGAAVDLALETFDSKYSGFFGFLARVLTGGF